jgi:hypothetical protein
MEHTVVVVEIHIYGDDVCFESQTVRLPAWWD